MTVRCVWQRDFDAVAAELTVRQENSEASRRKLVDASRELKKTLSTVSELTSQRFDHVYNIRVLAGRILTAHAQKQVISELLIKILTSWSDSATSIS